MTGANGDKITLPLTCSQCGAEQEFTLGPGQLADLGAAQQTRLPCDACGDLTQWTGSPADRRRTARRVSSRIQLSLPIRVRSDGPGLKFTEITKTLEASRNGASFLTKHRIETGTVLYVLMPYTEGEAIPEARARVVRVNETGEGREVGIEFLRSGMAV